MQPSTSSAVVSAVRTLDRVVIEDVTDDGIELENDAFFIHNSATSFEDLNGRSRGRILLQIQYPCSLPIITVVFPSEAQLGIMVSDYRVLFIPADKHREDGGRVFGAPLALKRATIPALPAVPIRDSS